MNFVTTVKGIKISATFKIIWILLVVTKLVDGTAMKSIEGVSMSRS